LVTCEKVGVPQPPSLERTLQQLHTLGLLWKIFERHVNLASSDRMMISFAHWEFKTSATALCPSVCSLQRISRQAQANPNVRIRPPSFSLS
jgi:hypothetical protein